MRDFQPSESINRKIVTLSFKIVSDFCAPFSVIIISVLFFKKGAKILL